MSANYMYYRPKVEGSGRDSLEGIDPLDTDGQGKTLAAYDGCLILQQNGEFLAYQLQDSAGAVHNPPAVVVPSKNAGTLWWKFMLSWETYATASAQPNQYSRVSTTAQFRIYDLAEGETRTITLPAKSGPDYCPVQLVVGNRVVGSGFRLFWNSPTEIALMKTSPGTVGQVIVNVCYNKLLTYGF